MPQRPTDLSVQDFQRALSRRGFFHRDRIPRGRASSTNTAVRGAIPWIYNPLSGSGIPGASDAVPDQGNRGLRSTVRRAKRGVLKPPAPLEPTLWARTSKTLCPMRIIVYNLRVSTKFGNSGSPVLPLKAYRSSTCPTLMIRRLIAQLMAWKLLACVASRPAQGPASNICARCHVQGRAVPNRVHALDRLWNLDFGRTLNVEPGTSFI